MKTRALLKLADYLEKTDFSKTEKKFDMREWDCGTAACAIGQGIHAKITPAKLKIKNGFIRFDGINCNSHGAISKAYGLSANQTDSFFLFSSNSYSDVPVSPKTVARRIRKFVEGK